MVRLVFGTIAGVVVGFAVVYGLETLGHNLFPVATGMDVTNRAELEAFMKAMPLGGLLVVVFSWISGAFAGATTGLVASGRQRMAGLIPPALVLLATIASLAMIPHPLWMSLSGPLGILAAAWLADRLFARKPA